MVASASNKKLVVERVLLMSHIVEAVVWNRVLLVKPQGIQIDDTLAFKVAVTITEDVFALVCSRH